MEELVFDGRSPLCSSPKRPTAKPVVCAPYSCSFLGFTQVICLHSNSSRQIFLGKKRLYLMYKNFSYRKPAVKDVSLALPLGAAAWHPPRGTICKPTLPAAVHQPPSWFWHFHLGAEHAGVVVPVKNIHLLPCACRDICLFGDEINLWPKHREIPSPAPPQQYSLWIFMIFDWFGASISPR